MIQKNSALFSSKKISLWRKLALGVWHGPGDPSVYGSIEVPVDKILEFIDKKSKLTGQRITLTHFFGKACGLVLRKHPEINSCLRFGRIYPRKDIAIFFQVASDSLGEDLSGALIRKIDLKRIEDIARELNTSVELVRSGNEKVYSRGKGLIRYVPGFLVRPFVLLLEFFAYTLNLWSPFLGIPRDGFGSMMITNIGSLGLDMVFAPLVPYSKVPFIVVLGAIKERPFVKNGEITVHRSLYVCVTLDHRLIDGVHGAKMSQTLLDICQNPEFYLI